MRRFATTGTAVSTRRPTIEARRSASRKSSRPTSVATQNRPASANAHAIWRPASPANRGGTESADGGGAPPTGPGAQTAGDGDGRERDGDGRRPAGKARVPARNASAASPAPTPSAKTSATENFSGYRSGMGERHSPQEAGRNQGSTQTAAAPRASARTKRDPRAFRETRNGTASTARPPQKRLEKKVRMPARAQKSWGSSDQVAPNG